MKKFILFIVVACNQVVYNSIYKALVVDAIKAGATRKAMQRRNEGIEVLRKLCNGQKSDWEKDK